MVAHVLADVEAFEALGLLVRDDRGAADETEIGAARAVVAVLVALVAAASHLREVVGDAGGRRKRLAGDERGDRQGGAPDVRAFAHVRAAAAFTRSLGLAGLQPLRVLLPGHHPPLCRAAMNVLLGVAVAVGEALRGRPRRTAIGGASHIGRGVGDLEQSRLWITHAPLHVGWDVVIDPAHDDVPAVGEEVGLLRVAPVGNRRRLGKAVVVGVHRGEVRGAGQVHRLGPGGAVVGRAHEVDVVGRMQAAIE